MDKNLRIQASADYIAINPIFKKCMYVVAQAPKILKDVPQIINSGYKCDYVTEMRECDYGGESQFYFFNLKILSWVHTDLVSRIKQ